MCVIGGVEYMLSKQTPCLRLARKKWWGYERNVPSVVGNPVVIKTWSTYFNVATKD